MHFSVLKQRQRQCRVAIVQFFKSRHPHLHVIQIKRRCITTTWDIAALQIMHISYRISSLHVCLSLVIIYGVAPDLREPMLCVMGRMLNTEEEQMLQMLVLFQMLLGVFVPVTRWINEAKMW